MENKSHGVALLLLLIIAFPYTLSSARAADMDLKPGDVIGPDNWQRVQGMVEKTCFEELSRVIPLISRNLNILTRRGNIYRQLKNTPQG